MSFVNLPGKCSNRFLVRKLLCIVAQTMLLFLLTHSSSKNGYTCYVSQSYV